jgi:TRAP-type C4-dicarboxylate transport system permease small subunit
MPRPWRAALSLIAVATVLIVAIAFAYSSAEHRIR